MSDNFDDFDLDEIYEQQQVSYKKPEEDENAARWGFNFLVQVPLFKHLGNQMFIDANKKDDQTGEIIVNRMYFPRLQLMPFNTMNIPVPAEMKATRANSPSYASHSRPFDPTVAEAQDLRTVITKSAAKCAEIFRNLYGKEGGVILDSLSGIKTPREANSYLLAVLPLADAKLFPRSTRPILGEVFTGPFLNDILKYLQSMDARQRLAEMIEKAGQGENADRLNQLYQELLGGAQNAYTIAKNQIADTEADMDATPQRKSNYDSRDPLNRNSPDPMDLLCLAHLDMKPKFERQFEEARKLQEINNAPILEVAKSMNSFVQMQSAANPLVGMTAEDIAKMVKKQVNDGIEKYKQEVAKAAK